METIRKTFATIVASVPRLRSALQMYADPKRVYHDNTHVEQLLAEATNKDYLNEHEQFLLAMLIVYHDMWYNPMVGKMGSSEEMSAALALEFMSKPGDRQGELAEYLVPVRVGIHASAMYGDKELQRNMISVLPERFQKVVLLFLDLDLATLKHGPSSMQGNKINSAIFKEAQNFGGAYHSIVAGRLMFFDKMRRRAALETGFFHNPFNDPDFDNDVVKTAIESNLVYVRDKGVTLYGTQHDQICVYLQEHGLLEFLYEDRLKMHAHSVNEVHHFKLRPAMDACTDGVFNIGFNEKDGLVVGFKPLSVFSYTHSYSTSVIAYKKVAEWLKS